MSRADPGVDLLRHGAVEGGTRFRGQRDDPLTPAGWRQMREAVESGGPWEVIVSSPLIRCKAFAEELAAERGISLSIDSRLAEIHFGEWEGRSYGELMLTSPLAVTRFFDDPVQYPPPGAEPMDVFRARVLAAQADLFSRGAEGRRVLAITHGGVIRLMLCHVRGWPMQRLKDVEVGHASLHALSRVTEQAGAVR
ncbi:histidine phosphatase family protein [Methylococcus sp. EFPC2]|uniref:histidine phosphatase family protein n=1 Tax=Methylococcus sp. EFPC2 TaxID=2812648 RepID=UPI0019685160|nr:histidine phosphatase family protein [Methylococcus sp. EFPC2]QSA97908.1 histidine phosphatase family protein [Methylococcus sp. EFPC2]